MVRRDERRAAVHVQHREFALQVRLGKAARRAEAGGRDEQPGVEAGGCLLDGGEPAGCPEVGRDGERLDAVDRAQLARERVDLGLPASDEDDVQPGPAEVLGEGATDAGRRAGDDGPGAVAVAPARLGGGERARSRGRDGHEREGGG